MGITFNGIELASALQSTFVVNAFVEHPPAFVLAEPDVQYTHVPGKNGDIIYDDGSYNNVLITYPIAVKASVEAIGTRYTNFQTALRGLFSKWLYPAEKSASGYYRLSDTYDIGHYRMARPYGQFELENIYGWNARGKLTFDCRPERYYSASIPPINISPPSGSIDNTNYNFPAYPRIIATVSGSGAFAIYQTGGNMYRVQIDNVNDQVVLDCIDQEATSFSTGENLNSHITITGVGCYPILEPGIVQNIAITGDIGLLRIFPLRYEI